MQGDTCEHKHLSANPCLNLFFLEGHMLFWKMETDHNMKGEDQSPKG